ncbi:DUF4011 domain-containing protein, partial [Flavobacterium filum]|uniref:DUF4011 domain-containing protein n=1 Tax=Flavobacterium filum TaxID=370974 RepID=UPI0023F2565C
IDVSKKNPLLSFKFSERSKTHIRIIDEVPDFVLKKLSEGKELTFEYVPNPNDIPSSQLTDKFYELLDKEKLSNKNYLNIIENEKSTSKEKVAAEYDLINKVRNVLGYKKIIFDENINVEEQAKRLSINTSFNLPNIYPNNIVPKKYSDNKLQTLMFRDGLNDKLHAIYSKATNILKETGVGSLYIIYGNLKWYEDNDKEKPIYTPILIQEVDITMYLKNNEYVYTITAIEDFPELNIVLQQKLKDLRLFISNFKEGDNIDNYFKNIKKIINEKYPDWEVLNYLTIGIVSSTNLILYEDLELKLEDFENNDGQLDLLESIMGYGTEDEEDMEDINHDDLLGTDKMPLLITDADGSQFSAINAVVNKEQNVIIQGPPGTGKSQTICNIISSAIHNNKSVLFLAEKLAALNVVKSRLDVMGIGDFCLEVHSNKIKKSEVIESLKQRIDLKKERKLTENINQFSLQQYIDLVKKINLYSELTNSQNIIFKENYFNLIWKYIKLADELNFSNRTDFKTKIKTGNFKSKDDIVLLENSLVQYKTLRQKFTSKYGKENNNLWKNFLVNKSSQKSEDEIIRITKNLLLDANGLNDNISAEGLYDKNITKLLIDNDVKILSKILELSEIANLDLNKFLKYKNIDDDYQILLKETAGYKKTSESLRRVFLNNKHDEDNFEEVFARLLELCTELKFTFINIKNLNSLYKLVSPFISSRAISPPESEIIESYNYVVLDLKDINNHNSIVNSLQLIKLENALLSNYLLSNNIQNITKVLPEIEKNISECRFSNKQVTEIRQVIKELTNSKKSTESLCSDLRNVYDVIPLEKIEYSYTDIQDLIKLKSVLEEYESKHSVYWLINATYTDLLKIKTFENKIIEIKNNFKLISDSLNFESLSSQDLGEIKIYLKDYKESGFFKIFKSSYWKLRNLKAYLTIKETDTIGFLRLLELYVNTKNSEQVLKTDTNFINIFGEIIGIFEIDFNLLNETITYKEKLKNISLINKENAALLRYVLISTEQQVFEIKSKLRFLKFDEELTKQFDFFEVSEIKSLIEMYEKELSKLESIDKVYQEFKLKPSLVVQDILKLNEYLDNWNKFNDQFQKDTEVLNKFCNNIFELVTILGGITLIKKFTIDSLHETKKLYIEYSQHKYNLKSNRINELILVKFEDLDNTIDLISQAHSILTTIVTSHTYLSMYFENENIDLKELSTKINTTDVKYSELLVSLNYLQTTNVVNIHKEFDVASFDMLKLESILEFFKKLVDDIDGYSDYVRYKELLSVINAFELNIFLNDFFRNELDENKIDKYFMMFVLSTYIDNFWQKNRYQIKDDKEKTDLESNLKQFQEEDKKYLFTNRSQLKKKLLSRTILDMSYKYYNEQKNKLATQKVGFDLINHETGKQTRHIPIRTLFEKAGEEVLFFKPCVMMSPQSVSQFLPKKDFLFDIIVIDEASQIKPEKCLASLMRGKQLVVVGDSKQLPPTFDYRKSLEDEDIINEDNSIQQEDEEIEES